MARLSKFERAKRQTRKKFRGIIKDLPEMDQEQIEGAIRNVDQCGFCNEYKGRGPVEACSCPFQPSCMEMLGCIDVVYKKCYWRESVAELCEWVLKEVDKVKE